MKHQALFSLKAKCDKIKVSSAAFFFLVLQGKQLHLLLHVYLFGCKTRIYPFKLLQILRSIVCNSAKTWSFLF